MKKIKTTLVFILAIAAMVAGIWGDRNLDAKFAAEAQSAPQTVVETTVE